MLPLGQVPSSEQNPVIGRTAAEELQYRMNRPQRHRLLHGYPQAAAMRSAKEVEPELDLLFDPKTKRELLIGVLPHPFCNPAVTGCGFCTFPHEPGNMRKDRGSRSALSRRRSMPAPSRSCSDLIHQSRVFTSAAAPPT